jgi:hypothetical protein
MTDDNGYKSQVTIQHIERDAVNNSAVIKERFITLKGQEDTATLLEMARKEMG